MKVMFCCRCGDVRAFETFYTACRCGNMEAMWLDPVKGTVRVRAVRRAFARIIGMSNRMLSKAQVQAMDGHNHDFSAATWREFHKEITDDAPGFLFDKSQRDCWACIIGIGSTSDIQWDPMQVEYDRSEFGSWSNPATKAELRLDVLRKLYKNATTLEELVTMIEKNVLA